MEPVFILKVWTYSKKNVFNFTALCYPLIILLNKQGFCELYYSHLANRWKRKPWEYASSWQLSVLWGSVFSGSENEWRWEKGVEWWIQKQVHGHSGECPVWHSLRYTLMVLMWEQCLNSFLFNFQQRVFTCLPPFLPSFLLSLILSSLPPSPSSHLPSISAPKS